MDTSDDPSSLFNNPIIDKILDKVPGAKKVTETFHPFEMEEREELKEAEQEILDKQAREDAQFAEEQRTRTAVPLTQQTELERRNRRRRASVLTRNFPEATLGPSGSLGAA